MEPEECWGGKMWMTEEGLRNYTPGPGVTQTPAPPLSQ